MKDDTQIDGQLSLFDVFAEEQKLRPCDYTFQRQIGQPVYDKDKNLMGYLGIGLYANLDYSTEGRIRIPVEHWTICLPTNHCVDGKAVYTYWQTQAERSGAE